jgi:hypothetical protein
MSIVRGTSSVCHGRSAFALSPSVVFHMLFNEPEIAEVSRARL